MTKSSNSKKPKLRSQTETQGGNLNCRKEKGIFSTGQCKGEGSTAKLKAQNCHCPKLKCWGNFNGADQDCDAGM